VEPDQTLPTCEFFHCAALGGIRLKYRYRPWTVPTTKLLCLAHEEHVRRYAVEIEVLS